MTSRRTRPSRVVAFLTLALLVVTFGCSGGSSGGVGGGDFIALRTIPPNNGRLFLNEPIQIDFSNQVDLSTADLSTVSFEVFDLNGTPLNERPAGTFALGRSAGDNEVGRRLLYQPRFPTNNNFDNGGFKPGRLYVVSLVGGDPRRSNVLKDVNGRPLSAPISFQFRTADGVSPTDLFADTVPGGPRRTGFSVTPSDGGVVPLSFVGREPVEVRLSFNQPLNPQDTNVPVNVGADPLQRGAKGRIFLEYDDPTATNEYIPATVELESNTSAGSVVVLRPIGVLPNNATIEVIVESTVEDLAGQSNAGEPAYSRTFATFRTRTEFPPQYDALVENFVGTGSLDTSAAFPEPFAALQDGRISASFEFEGGNSSLVYEPTAREVVLDTNFTTITPRNSPPLTVTGGVFSFASVTINENTTVRGTGRNPMVWLCSGDFTVNGTLSVDGSDGADADGVTPASTPTAGGVGAAGGGNGGRGSPNTTDRSFAGEAGFGPGQTPGGGGEGGQLSCTATCNRGSAGGGGSFAEKGDPWYPPVASTTPWPQLLGDGGAGCADRSLPGGAAGPRPFNDGRNENDFWGTGIDVFRGIRIQGELAAPRGGGGGGGGGDRSTSCASGDEGFATSDRRGGGGGGGGGVLIVKALGTIRIGPTGTISADGGNGGGGDPSGANDQGGGGGGGSGGMVVLMAGQGIEISVHGNENAAPPRSTYGEMDYSFAISADGGVGSQSAFSGTALREKYPPGTAVQWTARATGGFGGLGIVQLMVPAGDDSDGTGNRLDDNIQFVYLDTQGVRRTVDPMRKKTLLAWRGWPSPDGGRVDDDGNTVDIGRMEGDIRPAPVMLPAPFGPLSRARSRWVDLGFVRREPVVGTPDPNAPRVVQVAPGEDPPSPDYGDPDLGYPGTLATMTELGYSRYGMTGAQAYPIVQFNGSPRLPILSVDTDATIDGQPAYQVVLDPSASLGTTQNRYAHYRAQIFENAGATFRLAEFRVLGHDERSLWLEPAESGTFPANGGSLQVAAKFFEVISGNGEPEVIAPFDGSTGAPEANVRIGFAFHTNPADMSGVRFPSDPAEFVYDLRDPALLSYLATERPEFVQWDVLFNIRYEPGAPNSVGDEPLSGPRSLLGLEFLVLPFRF